MIEHLPPCLQLTPSTKLILGIFPAPKAAVGDGNTARRMQITSKTVPRDEIVMDMIPARTTKVLDEKKLYTIRYEGKYGRICIFQVKKEESMNRVWKDSLLTFVSSAQQLVNLGTRVTKQSAHQTQLLHCKRYIPTTTPQEILGSNHVIERHLNYFEYEFSTFYRCIRNSVKCAIETVILFFA
jgi:hypothetical protein